MSSRKAHEVDSQGVIGLADRVVDTSSRTLIHFLIVRGVRDRGVQIFCIFTVSRPEVSEAANAPVSSSSTSLEIVKGVGRRRIDVSFASKHIVLNLVIRSIRCVTLGVSHAASR